jgi:hypothetical protein
MKTISVIVLIPSFLFLFAQSKYNEDIDFSHNFPVSRKLPAKMQYNENLTNQIKSSLKYIEWTKNGKILDIIITDKNWKIQRNEFTGIISSRYLTAVILFEHNNDSQYYYLIPCFFIQNASFFGLIYGDAYFRMVLHYKIEKIKK